MQLNKPIQDWFYRLFLVNYFAFLIVLYQIFWISSLSFVCRFNESLHNFLSFNTLKTIFHTDDFLTKLVIFTSHVEYYMSVEFALHFKQKKKRKLFSSMDVSQVEIQKYSPHTSLKLLEKTNNIFTFTSKQSLENLNIFFLVFEEKKIDDSF